MGTVCLYSGDTDHMPKRNLKASDKLRQGLKGNKAVCFAGV